MKLTRKNATEWDMFNNEYYRFEIYPESKSNQHNLLMDLAGLGHSVYYCAPAFIENNDYIRFHTEWNIADNSVFIPLNDLQRNRGNDEHVVVYKRYPDTYFMCSDSKKIEGYIGWKSVKDDAVKREKKYNNISIFIEEIIPFIDSIGNGKADIISENLQNSDRLK